VEGRQIVQQEEMAAAFRTKFFHLFNQAQGTGEIPEN
jgi:hypothetical protein